MAAKPPIRLGPGAAVPWTGANFKAQWLFLQTLWTCSPKTIDALARIARCVESSDQIDGPLAVWAADWHLTDRWVLRAARRHVDMWRIRPHLQGVLLGHSGGGYWDLEWPAAPSWNPFEQSEAEFLSTIAAYVDRIKGLPEFVPTPTKSTGVRDFEWLVRYQVRGESYPTIAKDLPAAHREAPQSTVRAAVVTLARTVGLTLRSPGRSGRPRKVRRLG